MKFCLDRGGIAGGDGQTHHGLLDIAYLRAVPNIVVMAPKDEGEMRDMMFTMLEHTGPAAMRYPRGNGVGVPIDREPELLEIGKGEILRDGGEIAIVAYGAMVHPSLAAAERLAKGPHRNHGCERAICEAARRAVVARAGAHETSDRHR